MGRWIGVGKRPHGLLRAIGFLVLGALYSGVVATLFSMVLGLLLVELDPQYVKQSSVRLAAGLLFIVVVGATVPLLTVANIRRLPQLQWGSWWVMAFGSVVQFAAGVAAALGASSQYRVGQAGFWMYDFGAHQWSWALAACIGSASTLVALIAYSATSHHSESPTAAADRAEPSLT